MATVALGYDEIAAQMDTLLRRDVEANGEFVDVTRA
jgi:hypothetical protein